MSTTSFSHLRVPARPETSRNLLTGESRRRHRRLQEDRISIILNGREAVYSALPRATRADLVIIVADEVRATWAQLVSFKEAARTVEHEAENKLA